MPERRFRRPRHQTVAAALRALNAAFLADAECYFAGGTRIVLELGEYRESEDVDFLCASRDGYRTLRSTVSDKSLGDVLAEPLPLAREVRADRYGIRTFLAIDEARLKLELVHEGRIAIGGEDVPGIPVRCLDRVSCFAEKYLANADRGADDAMLARDIVDLAFMIEAWGETAAVRGAAVAREAYGAVVDTACRTAARRLLDDAALRRRFVTALRVTDTATLEAGLMRLARITRRRARGAAKSC
jgi:hypothetical protein